MEIWFGWTEDGRMDGGLRDGWIDSLIDSIPEMV